MTTWNWKRRSARAAGPGSLASVSAEGHPGLYEGGYRLKKRDFNPIQVLKHRPGLRKLWAEKIAVTNRARGQKVSLASVSILGPDREDGGDACIATADVPHGSQGPGPQAG